MPQDYIVKDLKVWKDRETNEPVQDSFGNFKASVSFSGVSEPIDMTCKKLPVIGESEHGVIEFYQTKAGAQRQKFTRKQKEEFSAPTPKKEWEPRADHHEEIKAQWAIGQAVALLKETGTVDAFGKQIEETARELYAMVDRVKGSSESTDPKDSTSQSSARQSSASGATTGQESTSKEPTRDWTKVGKQSEEEFANSMAKALDNGTEFNAEEPINLDDIPF